MLTLPPRALSKLQNTPEWQPKHGGEKEREVRRTRERAEKRLQTLTKEVDWRVAKAYIALADDPQEMELFEAKRKEGFSSTGLAKDSTGSGPAASRLELLAVDRYLDDEEWETQERMEGRSIKIAPFPCSTDGKERVNGGLFGRSWMKMKR